MTLDIFNFAVAAGPTGITAQQAANAGAPAVASPCGHGTAPATRDEQAARAALYPTAGRLVAAVPRTCRCGCGMPQPTTKDSPDREPGLSAPTTGGTSSHAGHAQR